jgi:outer membrane protein TolC
MKLLSVHSTLAATLCLLATVCQAKGDAPLTLAEVRTHAIAYSPKVKEINARFGRQAAESISIGALQNPILHGSAEIPTSARDGSPNNAYALSMSLPRRASDFGGSANLSRLIESVSSIEKQVTLQEFIAEVSVLYYSLWSLQTEENHLRDQLEKARRISSLLSTPSAAGRFSPPQKQIAFATSAKIEAKLLGLTHKRAQTKSHLMRMSDLRLKGRTLSKPSAVSLPDFSDIWNDVQENNHSLLNRYKLNKKIAQQRVEIARRDQFSGFEPEVGYSRNEEGDDFVGIGLSFELPFFNRNDSEIKRTETAQTATAATLAYLRGAEFEEEFLLLYNGSMAKMQQVKVYEEKVLPALNKALEKSEQLFQSGQLSLFELWTIQTDFHEALDRSMELSMESFQSNIEISILSGTILY